MGDVSCYNVIKLPSYTRVTLLVLFKNIKHLINALNMEHKKKHTGLFCSSKLCHQISTHVTFSYEDISWK